MDAIITRIQTFYDMKFDLIVALTYVLMNNFCKMRDSQNFLDPGLAKP